LQHRFVRRLALEIMTEAVRVAQRESVKLEKVSGTFDLEWMALSEADRVASGSSSLVAKHALLLAVGFRYRRMRSSMLGAIERGRTPAVDFLNGEVVDRARRHGVAAPVNASVRELVWKLSRREATPSLATLRALSEGLSAVTPAA
jgi:2-dehydropantoate 2-reductase